MKHFLLALTVFSSVIGLASAQLSVGPVDQRQAQSITVPSNTALKAVPAATYSSANRQGFTSAGDGGNASYTWSNSACSLASGAGDNGSQVAPNAGTGCWLATFSATGLDARIWGLTTGATDAAPALNAALLYANTISGGVVHVVAGSYTLLSQVVVQSRTRLQCVSNGQGKINVGTPFIPGGTMFSVQWGSGAGSSNIASSAAIVLKALAAIDNCGFVYPAELPTLSAPIEYGATILAANSASNYLNNGQSATNNYCQNCYSFIDFRGSVSGYAVDGARIEYNWGGPIAYGIRVNWVADWSHYDHNIFNSFTNSYGLPGNISIQMAGWTMNNGVAFEIGNSDWINLSDEQAFGYNKGVSLLFNGSYYHAQGPVWISHSQFDGCYYACISDFPQSSDTGIMDLRVTHNSFTAYNWTTATQSPGGAGIALIISGLSNVRNLEFSDNFIFGPTNYVTYGFAQRMLISNNQTYQNVASSIAAAGPAFTGLSGITGVTWIFTNNTVSGFGSVLQTGGTPTNLVNTGNFIQ